MSLIDGLFDEITRLRERAQLAAHWETQAGLLVRELEERDRRIGELIAVVWATAKANGGQLRIPDVARESLPTRPILSTWRDENAGVTVIAVHAGGSG